MKILLINEAFHPDAAASAQQLTDLAVQIAEAGVEVTVLTSRRSYAEKGKQYPAREKYRGIEIRRVRSPSLNRAGRKARMIDAMLLNLFFAWKLLWMKRQDKIVAMTSPPLVAWTAMVAAKLKKSEFIYWVMDVNPDQAVAAGWIKKGSLRERISSAGLRQVLAGSRKVIAMDSFMKERLSAKGAGAGKIKILPPWSHDESLETVPHESNPFRIKHGWQSKFIIMYSGNHSICHPLDTLLETARQLKQDPNLLFVFIGGGQRVRDVAEYKKKFGLENILQMPYQKREDLRYSLSAADLHVVTMGGPYVGIVHPCKIYGILKIGRPFVYIGPETSPVGNLIRETGVGYGVPHGDSQKLAWVIRNVRDQDVRQKQQAELKEKEIAVRFSKATLCSEAVNFMLSESENTRYGNGGKSLYADKNIA